MEVGMYEVILEVENRTPDLETELRVVVLETEG